MNTPQPPLRSPRESLFMAMPLVFALLLMLSIGVLLLLIWRGGSVSGPHVQMVFQGECAKEAQSFIDSRMAFVLGDSYAGSTLDGDRITIQTQLHDEPNVKTAFPNLISQRGLLEIKSESTVLATQSDLKSAGLDLDESGLSYVKLQFMSAVHQQIKDHVSQNPDGALTIHIDGDLAVTRPNSAKVSDDELKIISDQGDSKQRARTAADRALILKHGPLPCTLSAQLTDLSTDGN